MSARSLASGTPENGIVLPGMSFCGSAMYASSDAASQVVPRSKNSNVSGLAARAWTA